MSPWEGFDPLRSALENAGIGYAVGGSWASTALGEPRFTNDVDVLADLTTEKLPSFLEGLADTFYVDPDEAVRAILVGRPFHTHPHTNGAEVRSFPGERVPIGKEELERAISLEDTGLSKGPARFVTPEDILLAKLYWFRSGGEVSEVMARCERGCSWVYGGPRSHLPGRGTRRSWVCVTC
jgi:hypothetical protein